MLTKNHLEEMKGIENGATIWVYKNVKLLREVQKYDGELLTIIDDLEKLGRIENKVYDGAKQLPYFGAILTVKGKRKLKTLNSEFGQ